MSEFGTDEWLQEARVRLKERACFLCGAVGSLTLEWRMNAKALDDFSLSGAQMKVSALRSLICSCQHCDFAARVTEDK